MNNCGVLITDLKVLGSYFAIVAEDASSQHQFEGKQFVLASIKRKFEEMEMLHLFRDLLVGNYFNISTTSINGERCYVELQTPVEEDLKTIIKSNRRLSSFLEIVSLNDQISETTQNVFENPTGMNELVVKPNEPLLTEETIDAALLSFHVDHQGINIFVRPVESEIEFHRLQEQLDRLKRPLESSKNKPGSGTKCLVFRDNNLHRATVIKHSGTTTERRSKIVLLDFGYEVEVETEDIFLMPPEFDDIPPYARKFVLADYQQKSLSQDQRDELDFYLRIVAPLQTLKLKIVSSNSSIPLCQIFEGDTNILESFSQLNQRSLHYPEQVPLDEEILHEVTICSIESPKNFFVKTEESDEFRMLSREKMQTVRPPKLKKPKENDACIVKVEGVNMRGRIIKCIKCVTDMIIKVQFVDSGFIDDVHIDDIKVTAKEFTKIPPVAYQCCLQAFKRTAKLTSDVVQDFEKIVPTFGDRKMRMQIVQREIDGSLVVELTDAVTGMAVFAEDVESNKSDWTENSDPPCQETPIWSIDDSLSFLKQTVAVPFENGSDSGFTQRRSDSSSGKSSKGHGKFMKPRDEGRITKRIISKGAEWSKREVSMLHRKFCRVTAVTGATDFTIQDSTKTAAYRAFLFDLQKIAQTQESFANDFSRNSDCLARLEGHREWRRATILDIDQENYLYCVKCSDDGTTFTTRELKSYPTELLFKEFFGIKCSLPIIICDSKAFTETREFLSKLSTDELTYRSITNYNHKKFVELFHKKKNVADLLVERKLAKRVVVTPSGAAYIVRIFSLKDFVVQFDCDGEVLKQITRYTSGYNQIEVSDPSIGMIVLAQLKGGWYRARIAAALLNGLFNVYFIDFGHFDDAEKIGAIDDPIIAELHPIAYKCSMNIPFNMETQPIAEKFYELTDYGHTKFHIKLIQPCERFAIVEVFKDSDFKINVKDLLSSVA